MLLIYPAKGHRSISLTIKLELHTMYKNHLDWSALYMKVLATGGAGFIGSHIVDKLIQLGYKVIVVDNLSNGKPENVNPDAEFHLIDTADIKLAQLFAKESPRFVIHLAAQASVQNSLNNPLSDCYSNIVGSLNILECCRRYGVEKIIYSSTAAVYGEPQYIPIDENHSILPLSNYGVSKYAAEMYIRLYTSIYGLNHTILRYSNVYGPRQKAESESGVISIFSEKLYKKESPVIFGSGNQTRDFIYVEDIVEANILALSKANKQTLNISTNTSTSINELVAAMLDISGLNIKPIYTDSLSGDILQSTLNNIKAKQLLNWSPKFSLKDGLIKTL